MLTVIFVIFEVEVTTNNEIHFLVIIMMLTSIQHHGILLLVSVELHYTDTGYRHVVQHHQQMRP